MTDKNTAFETGLALRRDMFGIGGADKAIDAATEFSRPLQEMVTRYCFGEVWQRPGLDRKTRSMLTLAMLISNGRFTQFGAHVAASRQPSRRRRFVRRYCSPAIGRRRCRSHGDR